MTTIIHLWSSLNICVFVVSDFAICAFSVLSLPNSLSLSHPFAYSLSPSLPVYL